MLPAGAAPPAFLPRFQPSLRVTSSQSRHETHPLPHPARQPRGRTGALVRRSLHLRCYRPLPAYFAGAAAGLCTARRSPARQRGLLPGGLRRPGRQSDGAGSASPRPPPLDADDRCDRAGIEQSAVCGGDNCLTRRRPGAANAGDGHPRCGHQSLFARPHPAAGAQPLRAATPPVRRKCLCCGTVARRLSAPQRGGEPHLPSGGNCLPDIAHLLLDLAASRQSEPAGGNATAAGSAPVRVAICFAAASGAVVASGARPQWVVGDVFHLHADLRGQCGLPAGDRRRAGVAGPGADAAPCACGAGSGEALAPAIC